ncbi:MAG: hypothetical protein ACFFFB_13995 [Candidatus Heimdallarchaeota archaeon]
MSKIVLQVTNYVFQLYKELQKSHPMEVLSLETSNYEVITIGTKIFFLISFSISSASLT